MSPSRSNLLATISISHLSVGKPKSGEIQCHTRSQKCVTRVYMVITLAWNSMSRLVKILSRLLVLSIPVMNCSRVSLPSRSWSMRRKISRTRDLLSRSHLLNCEDETESQINDCKLSTHTCLIHGSELKSAPSYALKKPLSAAWSD